MHFSCVSSCAFFGLGLPLLRSRAEPSSRPPFPSFPHSSAFEPWPVSVCGSRSTAGAAQCSAALPFSYLPLTARVRSTACSVLYSPFASAAAADSTHSILEKGILIRVFARGLHATNLYCSFNHRLLL